MGPPAKRRKKEVQRFPCHTCLEDRTSSQFPEYNPTETCDHLINTCKRCLAQWVDSQIESKVFTPHMQCTQCNEKMKSSDVEIAVTKKVFARYVELERRWIGENTPGWRWCLNPKCKAGQVHDSSRADGDGAEKENKKPESKLGSLFNTIIRRSARAANQEEERAKAAKDAESKLIPKPKPAKPDICTCKDCGARACVPCDRPWHESESCEQYQARVKSHLEEEDANLAMIQSNTKKCPHCSKRIEKNGGCHHMFCTQCRSEFCWNCMHLINRNGQYCGCNPPILLH